MCQRRNEVCKRQKTIREDRLEETITTILEDLVCPAPKIIDWVVKELKKRDASTIQEISDSIDNVDRQIVRIKRMDSELYDDKLSGEIPKDTYQTKHQIFQEQLSALQLKKRELESRQEGRLPQYLSLLKLTQKATEIYKTRTIDQKRAILTKLFSSFTYSNGVVSVKYTNFAQVIANKSLKTKEILGR